MSTVKWEVEVDSISSSRWSQVLGNFLDANIYQTAAYGEVRWGEKNLSRLILKRSGEVVAAAQFRIIRPTSLKFGIAYLRWGPLWERRDQPVDLQIPVRMAEAIEKEYLTARKLCVQILPNAFAGTPRADLFDLAFSKFNPEKGAPVYRTFLLDLSVPLAQLRAHLDGKWRNKLKQAEKNGLTVETSDDVQAFRAFIGIYREMWKRKAFETTVNIDEFERIQQSLSNAQRMQVFLCKDGGIPVAGLVVTAVGDTAIYLLGATSDAGLTAKGAYILQWAALQWLQECGVHWYDLGGIDPEANPGVYSFKKGLSGVDICQIGSLIAAESTVSFGLAKAALALRQKVRISWKPPFAGHFEKKATSAN